MRANLFQRCFLAAGLGCCLAAHAQFTEPARQALRLAADDLRDALRQSTLPKTETLAILPVQGDRDAYAIGLIKNAATEAGLTCVEGKEDPFWDEVVKEVEWDERKDDILDGATLAKFGRLKAAKLLLYGAVRGAGDTGNRGYAELEVHVSAIETKQHLWGKVFARRFYRPGEVTGLVDIDPDVRQILRQAFDATQTRLKSAEKLQGIRNIAIVPLAGDLDGFVTGLAENMLSGTQFFPKHLDFLTLGEARAYLRDNPAAADAVLSGALRDLSRKKLNEYPTGTNYEVSASVQLTIQSAKTGDVLWSDTIEARGADADNLSWWETLRKHGPIAWAFRGYVLWPLLIIAGLIALTLILRAMRRAR